MKSQFKSSIFIGRINFQIKQKRQYLKELKHLLRVLESDNIDLEKTNLNKYFIYDDENNLIDFQNISNEEIYILLTKHFEELKENYKNEFHNPKEDQELNNKLIEQRRNTKKRLEDKNLSLEKFEESNLTTTEYINQNWTKEYKSESMTEAMKKRTLESLNKYIDLTDKCSHIKRDKQISGNNTLFQELVIKIPLTNKYDDTDINVDFTINEMNTILKKQIEKETQRGNKIKGRFFHFDESSNHIHILIENKNFDLVHNQQTDILKKYNLDYDLKNLTDEQLRLIGVYEQENDRDLINDSMKQDIKFVLVSEISDLEEHQRKKMNKEIRKVNSHTNINNRKFNYVNFKEIENKKQSKDLFLKMLELELKQVEIEEQKQLLDFSSYRPSFNLTTLSNEVKNYFSSSYTNLKLSLDNLIKEFKSDVHISVLEDTHRVVSGRTDAKKLRDEKYLNNLRDKNIKRKQQSEFHQNLKEQIKTMKQQQPTPTTQKPKYDYTTPSFY